MSKCLVLKEAFIPTVPLSSLAEAALSVTALQSSLVEYLTNHSANILLK